MKHPPGLVSRPSSLFTAVSRPTSGMSCVEALTQVYAWLQNLEAFRTWETGVKRTKCDQFFLPTSDFSDFCYPHFFYHTTDGVGLVYRAEICKICNHSLFPCQLWKITIGVLGAHVATSNMDHSPVSWCKPLRAALAISQITSLHTWYMWQFLLVYCWLTILNWNLFFFCLIVYSTGWCISVSWN